MGEHLSCCTQGEVGCCWLPAGALLVGKAHGWTCFFSCWVFLTLIQTTQWARSNALPGPRWNQVAALASLTQQVEEPGAVRSCFLSPCWFLLERPWGKGKVKSPSELSFQCYWDTARGMEESYCAQCHPSWRWHTNMRILYLLSFLCLQQQCLSILPFYVSLIIQFVLLTVIHNALEFAKHPCELLGSQGKVYLQNIICHLLSVFWRCTLICNRNGVESTLK